MQTHGRQHLGEGGLGFGLVPRPVPVRWLGVVAVAGIPHQHQTPHEPRHWVGPLDRLLRPHLRLLPPPQLPPLPVKHPHPPAAPIPPHTIPPRQPPPRAPPH